ncbi:MAG: hypothetical protein IPF92_18820 [Myxococcales bacterium]|jgi:hypothetical protein|nr:hypothetical protein [Myxococcales bacterium]MBL0194232.1 hypothetical protein [Myxococcales bacterium]
MKQILSIMFVGMLVACGGVAIESASDSGAADSAPTSDASAARDSASDARGPKDAAIETDDAGCPVDFAAAAGTPCSPPGRGCGTCTDPCQFCRVLRCQLGKWENLEVFPLPCDASAEGG